MGSAAFFMGFPVVGLEFNRARGFQATPSKIEIHVPDLEGVVIEQPAAGQLVPGQGEARALAFDAARGASSTEPQRPRTGEDLRLRWAGWLGLCEIAPNGDQHGPFVLGPLFVVSCEAVRRSNTGAISRARLVVSDARYLWDRGLAPRWSYNRKRPDGTFAQDARKPDGSPWSRREILADLAGALHGAPAVSRAPADFEGSQGGAELAPGSAALEGLAELVRRWGLAEPCLDLDGRVSFWRSGEGKIGASPDGVGENPEPLPPELYLDKAGTGVGHRIEFGHPPEHVLVFGGPRVATVAVDNWIPVLHVENQFLPLTEDLVRRLTKGLFGIGDLARFVLAEDLSRNGLPGVPAAASRLLLGQAWRLWRIPGAENANLALPGKNAHLLPLLDRAELVDGRRMPVTVETFSFAVEHYRFAGSEEATQLLKFTAKLDELRALLAAEGAKAGLGDPFAPGLSVDGLGRFRSVEAILVPATSGNPPIRADEVMSRVGLARSLHRAAKINGTHAAEYERIQREAWKLTGREDLGLLMDLGKEWVQFEAQINAGRGLLQSADAFAGESPEQVEALRTRVASIAEQVRRARARQAQELAQRGGLLPERKSDSARYHRNMDRTTDPDARVYNAAAGVIQTSRLAGHLTKEGGAVATAGGPFVPRPVRVIFGAVLRPRVDLPLNRLPRGPVTQAGSGAEGGEGDVIPRVLSDREGYFQQLFARGAGAPVLVNLDALQEPERKRLLAQAAVVRHPELVELVPLVGSSNGDQLALEAAALATDAMNRTPVSLREQRLTVGRPWLVNCNGLVAGVQIRMRPRCAGFETVIEIGRRTQAIGPLTTTPRRALRLPGLEPDAARREGLTTK